MAGLVVCLFAKFQERWDNRNKRQAQQVSKLCINYVIVYANLRCETFRGVVRRPVGEELQQLVQKNKRTLNQSKTPTANNALSVSFLPY